MTEIASSLINTGFIANQTDSTIASSEIDEISTDVNDQESSTEQSSVELSTRSQKLQKLNEEFFSAGPSAFEVSSEFISRLEEYGFITTSEATRLSASVTSTESASTESTSTISELSSFIDDLVAELESSDSQSSLISILEEAQLVIDNIDSPTAESRAVNIQSVVDELKNASSNSELELSDSDQEALNKLTLTLSIANNLSSGSTSAEIDRYLAISNFDA
ncbi:hypothetical protein [Reinekea thalattae]|uniref:Uncharacterized protein n=1 Tax=Reinekea thalattae TaxID=2593301 RepID=A0A5C8Z5Y9_9GAMM|nr:hypothetical protein [Reinekea thalattae]TXR53525.1 hypothetical protein FME95_02860 [Reinekea thalattae]